MELALLEESLELALDLKEALELALDSVSFWGFLVLDSTLLVDLADPEGEGFLDDLFDLTGEICFLSFEEDKMLLISISGLRSLLVLADFDRTVEERRVRDLPLRSSDIIVFY